MGGKIDVYLDIVSFYSYLAFLDIAKNREALASHSVEVEFHPVLLGGINNASGNKPPWTLPAKAKYGQYDAQRSMERFPGLVIQFPKDLMAVAMTVVPLRALHYIKSTASLRPKFETALHYLMYCFWSPPNMDLSKPDNVVRALSECPASFRGYLDGPVTTSPTTPSSPPLFTPDEVKSIMAAVSSQEIKDSLKKATQEALDRGAFGAPWLWVTNDEGKSEPFFGSDRFHFVYKFLGLPVQELALIPAESKGPKLWTKQTKL